MEFIDLVQDRVWAIYPPKLEEINSFIESRLNNEKTEFTADTGMRGQEDGRYQVVNGTAIIPVHGVINKRMNLITRFSGGTSTELLKKDIQAALDDFSIKGIVLDIDSPGGSVDGTKELADFIFESRGIKPITAYANGMMASAAYWIGSAADSIVAYETSVIGSIGVALTHYDYSKRDERVGVKRTQIYAGKYKRIASDDKPLGDEGREYLQSMVDTYYSIFVESVAKNRGISVEKTIKEMADGKDYIGNQALKVGLVDMIGGMNLAVIVNKKQGERNMDIKTLKQDHSALYQEVFNLGAASINQDEILNEALAEGEKKGIEKGVETERKRVTDILAAGGDMETAIKAIQEGVSADGVYRLFFESEKAKKAKGIKEMEEEATASQGQEAQDDDDPHAGKSASEKLNALTLEMMEAEKMTYPDALKKVKKQHPELVEGFAAEAVNRADKK